MVILKATKQIEAGVPPTELEWSAMRVFNEDLVKAGMRLSAEGLQPSSNGARIQFKGGETTVVDGPFAETKELVGGFWIVQAKSKQEVIEFMRRAPFTNGELEVRPMFENDLDQNPTSEHHDAEAPPTQLG
ncbi:MAG: YciI family protein [Tepidiformaceae bacterium]